jgi:hypothetical protein
MEFWEFEKYINEIKQFYALRDGIDSVCHQYGRKLDAEISFPDLTYSIVNLLEKIMDDEKSSWIDYWIYELNFGEDYIEGCVTDLDGKVIPLKTTRELYDFLIQYKN